MKITAKTDFKHGRAHLRAGRTYDVPDVLGGYFVGVGWANPAPAEAVGDTVDPLEFSGDAPKRQGDTLEVQDVESVKATEILGDGGNG